MVVGSNANININESINFWKLPTRKYNTYPAGMSIAMVFVIYPSVKDINIKIIM